MQLNPAVVDIAASLATHFAVRDPFRHVVIDHFFAADDAVRLLQEFPPFERGNALNEAGLPGLKSTIEKIAALGGSYAELDQMIQSPAFLNWLSQVTGIPGLLYDPHYFGGGTHENKAGQDLDVHIDFNRHPVENWHRRLNLIVYLNPAWDASFGGALELHSDPRRADDQVRYITPEFNRCVVFETTENSWHGFSKISFPTPSAQASRRSIALYFYTLERPEDERADTHSTIYVDRPLPERFRAGMTLTEADVEELKSLWNRRMQHHQMLYRELTDVRNQLHRQLLNAGGSFHNPLRRIAGKMLRALGWRPPAIAAAPAAITQDRAAVVPGSQCPICERVALQTSLGEVLPTHPAQFHVSAFSLLECGLCESVYLDPRPTGEDLRALYQDGVQFSDSTYTEASRVAAMMEYYGGCLKNHQLLPPVGGRMLEVGAGFAWVARACKSMAPGVITIAQDVTAECVERCPWVDQYLLGEIDVAAAHGPYQLISLTHVIEHLVSPLQAIGALARLLAPGGKLFITAPFRPKGWRHGDGLDAWLKYPYLHVPAHISYLTQPWFKQAAEKWNLRLIHWDPLHDDQQAFEAILERH